MAGTRRGRDVVTNPRDADDLGKPRFFQPTEASERVIAFVLEALDIDAATLGDRDTVTIREQESVFEVDVESPDAGSNYTVARDTGEILDSRHSHNMPMPGVEGEQRFDELVD